MNSKRRLVIVLFSGALLVALAFAAGAWAPVEPSGPKHENPNLASSGQLVDEPKRWDGEDIEFTGEAIGERMDRASGTWVHLNDDAYMFKNVEEGAPLGGFNSGIPVWVEDSELVDTIQTYGDYKHEGDVVRVAGVYNAACSQHGGDTDIHATSVDMVTPGRIAKDPVKAWKIPFALLLVAAAASSFLVERRMSRREARGLPLRR